MNNELLYEFTMTMNGISITFEEAMKSFEESARQHADLCQETWENLSYNITSEKEGQYQIKVYGNIKRELKKLLTFNLIEFKGAESENIFEDALNSAKNRLETYGVNADNLFVKIATPSFTEAYSREGKNYLIEVWGHISKADEEVLAEVEGCNI